MVIRPLDSLQQTTRGALCRIGYLWLLAAITGIIQELQKDLLEYYGLSQLYGYTVDIFLFVFNFIMPMSIASVAYYRMYRGLKKPIAGSNPNTKQVNDRRKLANKVIGLVVIFCVMILPYHVTIS